MIIHKNSLLLYIIIFFYVDAHGQKDLNNTSNPKGLDKSITHGILENGLTFYIKPLEEPEKDVKMMFLVKAGYSDENSKEIGFAHHIEHLAFRNTENFLEGLKGNSELLAALKMKDSDLGGMTGDKMTQYRFDLPENNMQSINTGLLWFKDIANGLDLSEKNINRERGVILQEFLGEEGTKEAMSLEKELESKLFPCIENHTFLEEHNNSFPIEDLLEFHTNWYRPDLMAIVLVGNISNPVEITQKIKNLFGTIESPSEAYKVKDCDSLYLNTSPGFSVIGYKPNSKDSSYTKSIKIQLFFKDPKAGEFQKSIKGVERSIKVKMITTVLNKRFKELEQVYSNSAEYHSSYEGLPFNSLEIILKSDLKHEKETLQKSISTLKQLRTFGITGKEIESMKDDFLSLYTPLNNSKPNYWLGEILKHAVYNEVLPNGKNAHLRTFIKNLSTEDFRSLLEELIPEMPQNIGIILPEDYTTEISSEKGIRNIIKKAFKKPVLPYKNPEIISKILTDAEEEILPIGEAVKVGEGELGGNEYRLKNGMKVILRPINSTDKKIVFKGFSPYGASCFPAEEYYTVMLSPSVIKNAGVGNFTKFDLQRFYASSHSLNMGLTPYVSYNESGLKANVSVNEIEDLLQLTYLFFAKPRKDSIAFKDWQAEQLFFTAQALSPNNDLIDNLNELTNDFSVLPYASERFNAIKKVDFEKAYHFYNQIFGDPSRFTFILTGNFDEDAVLLLVRKYLGNINQRKKMECDKFKGRHKLKKGPVYREIKTSNFYDTENSFYGLKFIKSKDGHKDWQEELQVKALGLVANRLLYSLRSKKGLSLYYFGAAGSYNRSLERYELTFMFNCTPAERSLIMQHTGKFIENLKHGEVSKEVLQHAINYLLAYSDITGSKTNSHLANSIYLNYRFGETFGTPSEREHFIRNLSLNDITETANKYFRDENKYELVMDGNLQ